MSKTLTITFTDPSVIADVEWRLANPNPGHPLSVSVEGIGRVPESVSITNDACLGTSEFTHGELTEREGTCHVCGGHGHE